MAKICFTLAALCVLSATTALQTSPQPGAGYYYEPAKRIAEELNEVNSTIADNDLPNRIVGGVPISIEQAPYQVALTLNGKFICGASVLAKRWVLTAAHCVQDAGTYRVRAGTRTFRKGGQARNVTRVVSFGKFNPKTEEHDIALLQLAAPFKFNRFVRPVKLPTSRSKLPKVYTVTGWGTQSESKKDPSAKLLAAQIVYVDSKKCASLYNGQAIIKQTMLCAAYPGKDSCQGDSGGPLAANGVQYGIVSFGIGCANRRYPGVYTDMRYYVQWTKNVLKKFS